jgi:hypothetical protein
LRLLPLGWGRVTLLAVVAEQVLDALGIGGSDALADRQFLLQVGDTVAGVAVPDRARGSRKQRTL